MSDTQINIDYVAQLARLELTPEEKITFTEQLGQVLDYFKKIDAVDVSGVEPTAHAFPLYNVWDADKVRSGFTQQEALANAPAAREGQILVPRVVEG